MAFHRSYKAFPFKVLVVLMVMNLETDMNFYSLNPRNLHELSFNWNVIFFANSCGEIYIYYVLTTNRVILQGQLKSDQFQSY